MRNIIDKDYSLFFPRTSNFLLFGGNFLFSKRLYEIAKRELEIRRIDYQYDAETEFFECIDNYGFNIHIDSTDRICGLVSFYGINTLVFTSEVLLFLNNEHYESFLSLLKSIKERMNLKFIFISISNPLHACKRKDGTVELSNVSHKNWYTSRLSDVESILDSKTDLVYRCSSYYTYIISNIQTNPLHLIDEENDSLNIVDSPNDFSLDLADDIINDIIPRLNHTGGLDFEQSSNKTSLLDFVHKYKNDDILYSYVKKQNKCALNLIYRKKLHEIVNNRSVAGWRFEFGVKLKDVIPTSIVQNIDIIVPIPETGKYYAQGLSQAINKPYVEAFYKKSEIGRSFDIKDNKKRNEFITSKLGIISDLVKDKNIGIVDEAIFSGNTLKIVMEMLKTTEVKSVYIFIPTPICNSVCMYGMQPDRVLLLEKISRDELTEYFGVEDVVFQNEASFDEMILSTGHYSCCFSST